MCITLDPGFEFSDWVIKKFNQSEGVILGLGPGFEPWSIGVNSCCNKSVFTKPNRFDKKFFSEMSLGEFSEQLFILCIKLYRVTKNTPTQNSLFHIRKKVRTGERVCVCVCVCVSQ